MTDPTSDRSIGPDTRHASRRTVLRFAAGTAASALLAACGSGTLSTPTNAPAPTAPKPAGTTAPASASAPTTAPAASAAITQPVTTATTGSAVAPGTGTNVAKSADIKIGVLYPLSGSLAQAGNEVKAAVALAVDVINEAHPELSLPLAKGSGLPAFGGAKIVPVYVDNEGKPEVGQSEAERLITSEKVVALYGAYSSAVTKTSSAVAERLGIPFVNGESSSPDLTERGFKWFYRTTPNDTTFSEAMFAFIKGLNEKKNAGIKSVALFYEDTDFGTNSAKTQKELAAKNGIAVTADVKYRASATSLTTEVQTLKAGNPDLLLPTSYGNDAILLIKTMKELDFNPKLIVAQDAGFTDNSFFSNVGKDAEGVTSRSAFSSDILTVKPQAKTVNDLFKTKNGGRDIIDISARSFTGFITLADAINRAGSPNPDAIRQALDATNTPGDQTIMPWPGVKFDEKHQNTLGTAIIVQFLNGAYKTVFPFEFATTDVVFPIKKWSERK
jgi:branched-chain amino acid transport system substrate-binding protein